MLIWAQCLPLPISEYLGSLYHTSVDAPVRWATQCPPTWLSHTFSSYLLRTHPARIYATGVRNHIFSRFFFFFRIVLPFDFYFPMRSTEFSKAYSRRDSRFCRRPRQERILMWDFLLFLFFFFLRLSFSSLLFNGYERRGKRQKGATAAKQQGSCGIRFGLFTSGHGFLRFFFHPFSSRFLFFSAFRSHTVTNQMSTWA